MTIREVLAGMIMTDSVATYKIGFINVDGIEDETELDAEDADNLEKAYQIFCEDNGLKENTVTYMERRK